MSEQENIVMDPVMNGEATQAEAVKSAGSGTTARKRSTAPRKKASSSVTDAVHNDTVDVTPAIKAPVAPAETTAKRSTTRRRTPKNTAAKPLAEAASSDTVTQVPPEATPEGMALTQEMPAPEEAVTEKPAAQEAAVKKPAARRRRAVKPAPQADTAENISAGADEAPAKTVPVEPLAIKDASAMTVESAACVADAPSNAIVPADAQMPAESTPAVQFPESVANIKRSFFARIALILAIVAVFAVSAFIYYNRPAVYTEQTDSVNFLYVQAENKTIITVNGTVRHSADGALVLKSQNGHGDVCAALIGETLYVINGKSVQEIAHGAQDFVLSANGDTLAYRTAPSFLYYRKTDEKATPSLISRECYYAAYCLSPDGKQLVYTAGLGEEMQMRVESYAGTRPYIPAVRGCLPVAVTNGCDFVYYLNADGALTLFDRARDTAVVCAQSPDITTLSFNRDFSELLFVENGKTVLIAEGERQDVFDGKEAALYLVPNNRVAMRVLTNAKQYMTTTFYKSYYLLTRDDGLYLLYLDRNGEWSEVSRVDSAEMVTVTDKRVFFMLTNEHARTELLTVKVGKNEITRIDWDVTTYCPNVDGSRVLYTRDENALYLYRPEFGISRMADSILPDTLCVTADDLFCYVDASGMLCVSENGAEARQLCAGAMPVCVDAHTLFYMTDMTEQLTFTVWVNYRAERVSDSICAGVSALS